MEGEGGVEGKGGKEGEGGEGGGRRGRSMFLELVIDTIMRVY